MGKSQYPQKFDTSVELPAVRDNTLSDPVNSLRSAIFQIERVLGINPQGSTGNTVASRISRSLDSSGNILPSALTQAGVLSGPIDNKDVSDTAAIAERKLDLTFPTQLLQDQISMVQSDLDAVDSQIKELSTKLSIHLSSAALNSHAALSISLTPTASTGTDTSIQDLTATQVQAAFEELYDSHINYTGAGITSTNNSHLANQIYFDDTNVSGSINADNVQDALELAADSGTTEKGIHQDAQHSNGILRLGKLENVVSSEQAEVLANGVAVTFSEFDGNSDGTTRITLDDTVTLGDFDLAKFDFVTIVDSTDTDELYVGTYEIESFITSAGDILSIDVYGILKGDSSSSTTIVIAKNTERETNLSGLLVTTTQEATLTSSRIFNVSNPNANRVMTRNINPLEITASKNLFNLDIDGTTYEIGAYNAAIPRQTIDSIVVEINETLSENAAHAFAYRFDKEEGGSEVVIAHTIPDSSGDEHTLTISRAGDDGIDALGFAYIEDIPQETVYGSKYFINGETYSGLKNKINTTELAFFAGSNNIGIGNSSIDFIQESIKIGDIAIITNAPTDSDNGSYLVREVSETQIRLDSGQLPSGFTGSSDDSTRVRIYSASCSLEGITFDEVGGTLGSTVVDIFMDKNRDILYSKVLEYESILVSTSSILDVVDIEGSFEPGATLTINAEENALDPDAFYINIDGADPINIVGEGKYVWLTSHDLNIRLKIYVEDAGVVGSKISTDGTGFSITVYLLNETNTESNMLLARTLYANFDGGKISGGFYGSRVFRKLFIGNMDEKDFGSRAKEELIFRPRSELRYNGVIYGFEIENQTIDGNGFYNFDIRRGVCYVNGKRIVKDTVTSITTDIDSASIDKIYVVVDEYGNYQIESAVPTLCITPFGETEYAIIGSVEYDGVNVDYIDLRLFVDHLDLKILNEITVSPQAGMAHFIDPVKAIKYAKRFGEIFPSAATPIVKFKSGVHTVSVDYSYAEASGAWNPNSNANRAIFYDGQIESGLFIDFPVVLEGEGSQTTLELINNSTFTDTSYSITMPIVIAGTGLTVPSRGFGSIGDDDHVEIKNLRLLNSRVSLVDLNIDSGGIALRFDVKLQNIIFDYQTFAGTFIDGSWLGPRGVEILEIDDTSSNKGNLTIDNCTFIKSNLHTDVVSRTKNLSITNNVIIDDNDSTNFLQADLYSFATATSGSNINIVNNRYNSNLNPNDGTGPEIVAGDTLRWGERFDRDIRVGGTGYFGDLISQTYSTITPLTASKVFTWDMYENSTGNYFGGGSPSLSSASKVTADTFSGTWLVVDIGTGNDKGFMRISAPIGTTIKSIEIGVERGPTSAFQYDWTIAIHEQPMSGANDTTFGTFGPVTSTENAGHALATFDNINLTVAENVLYTLEISHDESSPTRHYYTKVVYEFTTLEAALGAL